MNWRQKNYSKTGGFTLIELLVVISIIGLLSSMVLASVNGARARAKNSNRITDLRELNLALEMYYNKNGAYPITWNGQSVFLGVHSCYPSQALGSSANWIPGLAPEYISSLARDPTDTSVAVDGQCATAEYLYRSDDGKDFKLLDYAITSNDCASITATAPQLRDPARDGGSNASIVDGPNCYSIGVWTPGGVAW